jgi:hypothetical protein
MTHEPENISSFSQVLLCKIGTDREIDLLFSKQNYTRQGVREMKKIIFLTGSLLILTSIGFGQATKPESRSVSATSASDANVLLSSGTRIDGQLQNTVDVKKARVGDEVVLKTTKSIKQNGQTVVPKGSRLIGRVTDVQQRSKANGESRLGMVFDRLEGKDLGAPISASIVSITNAAAGARIGDTSDADLFGSSSTSARTTSSSSSGGSGGGLLGGGGGLVGGVTSTAGSVLNTTTQTAGSITNTVGQSVGSTAGSTLRTINGVQIANSISGSAQSGTTLSSPDKNIRLEKGVMMQLQINNSVIVP